mmetsp:Transcript_51517/g.122503  ORF Transcript_51517/g.122503 Transcript_51517/m.122503 type:complete len:458 (-) Transcript_51517:69-1442(-)
MTATVATSPGMSGIGCPASNSLPRYICFLCKRKFKTADSLTQHKNLSMLHRRNLAKQDEEIQQRKEELRQAIASTRRQIQALGAEDDVQSQRKDMEQRLRHAHSEYGLAQEKLEANRVQQQADRPMLGSRCTEVHETTIRKLTISAGSATWQGNKEVQEDRYVLDIELEAPGGEKVIGFCVLDGHSGSLCVDAIVEWLPRNLQKCLAAKPSLTEDTLKQAMTEACVLTDDEFLSKAREKEVLDGSTMLTCLVFPSSSGNGLKLLVCNLGDSRAVLCQKPPTGGQLLAKRLSEDHKPGRADERTRITSKGGIVDMQGVWRVFTPCPATFGGRSMLWGLAVSRAFGDILMKEPQRYGCASVTGELVTAMPEVDIYDLNPAEDCFLIMACDGVWDVLGDEEAVAICSEHRSVDNAAHALIRRSFEIGSDDNLTALVVAWQREDGKDSAAAAPSKKRAKLD